jgi:hypothetical protein
MMPIKILGLDPGKSTGWGMITVENRKIQLGLFGVTKDMTLREIDQHFREADVVVYEGFWINPKMAAKGDFNWDQMPAPQVIGVILRVCAEMEISRVEKQSSSVKPAAYGFAGMKYRKGMNGMHAQDAIAHACYYAVKKLLARPVGAERAASK